jgi:hypothetical protein
VQASETVVPEQGLNLYRWILRPQPLQNRRQRGERACSLPFQQQSVRTRTRRDLDCLSTKRFNTPRTQGRYINYSLMLFIAKYVAVNVDGLMLSRKKPLYEPSLHCKSVLLATSTRDLASAAAGAIPAPNEEVEVTAVPANSTPRAPFPVTGS